MQQFANSDENSAWVAINFACIEDIHETTLFVAR